MVQKHSGLKFLKLQVRILKHSRIGYLKVRETVTYIEAQWAEILETPG